MVKHDNSVPSLRLRIGALVEPAFLLTSAVYHFFAVIFDIVVLRSNPQGIFPLQDVKDTAFSNFWNAFSSSTPQTGELTGSAALIPPLFAKAYGNILHIGPGSGTQVQCFTNRKITKLYLAEPAKGLHANLEANVRVVPHLQNKFQILPCGADAVSLMRELEGSDVINGSSGLFDREDRGIFDTIVCVRVLCSVPLADETVRELYGLLRPGGKFLIAEHVKNPWLSWDGNLIGRLAQILYMLLGWEFFMGGCCLNRKTKTTLDKVAKEQDGGWESDTVAWNFGWGPLPYVAGELQKRFK